MNLKRLTGFLTSLTGFFRRPRKLDRPPGFEIGACRVFTLKCLDGPFKGYTERRALVIGDPFFLNLENEAGETASYEVRQAITKETLGLRHVR